MLIFQYIKCLLRMRGLPRMRAKRILYFSCPVCSDPTEYTRQIFTRAEIRMAEKMPISDATQTLVLI